MALTGRELVERSLVQLGDVLICAKPVNHWFRPGERYPVDKTSYSDYSWAVVDEGGVRRDLSLINLSTFVIEIKKEKKMPPITTRQTTVYVVDGKEFNNFEVARDKAYFHYAAVKKIDLTNQAYGKSFLSKVPDIATLVELWEIVHMKEEGLKE